MIKLKNTQDVLYAFAHTHKGYGTYSISADQVQIETITGQKFTHGELDTGKLIFRNTGLDIRILLTLP